MHVGATMASVFVLILLIIFLNLANSKASSNQCSLCSNDNGVRKECDYPDKIVTCHENDYVTLQPCFCLWRNATVSYCFYTCLKENFTATSVKDLDQVCEEFNREGAGDYCGTCRTGTGFPAYSFSLKCVECNESKLRPNIAVYIAIAYVPLTFFLIFIVVFRVSINSAPMHGFIFVAQVSSSMFQGRIAQAMIESNTLDRFHKNGIKICMTLYGVWNLDFFRIMNPRRCIHPGLSAMQVMVLDYAIASYPCVLLLVIYALAEFHRRGYRIFIILWKPFHCYFARFRHQLNIKTSMADAFGTFFSMSYAKTLSTTLDLMAATKEWDNNGKVTGARVYYEGNVIYRSTEHVPFIVVACLFFTIFNFLPIPVLFMYSWTKDYAQDEESGFFKPLANTFLACYKDGRNGGLNCRWFGVVYLLARILIALSGLLSLDLFTQMWATVILISVAMLVVIVKPYKSSVFNKTDIILLLTLAMSYMSIASFFFTIRIEPKATSAAKYIPALIFLVPIGYLVTIVLYKTILASRLPYTVPRQFRYCKLRLTLCLKKTVGKICAKREGDGERHSTISTATSTLVTIESDTVTVQTFYN